MTALLFVMFLINVIVIFAHSRYHNALETHHKGDEGSESCGCHSDES